MATFAPCMHAHQGSRAPGPGPSPALCPGPVTEHLSDGAGDTPIGLGLHESPVGENFPQAGSFQTLGDRSRPARARGSCVCGVQEVLRSGSCHGGEEGQNQPGPARPSRLSL